MKRLWIPMGLTLLVSCLIEIILGITEIQGEDLIFWNILMRTVFVVPGLWYCYYEDKPFRGKKNYHFRVGSSIFFFGILLSAGFRMLFHMLGISGYEEATRDLFSGNVILQCVTLLLASPIFEEMFFRGVFYMRLKERVSVRSAAVISAICFGFYHGNFVQGIYGFLMGLILAWVMERCQTVSAPLMFHIGANVAAVMIEKL